MVGRWVLATDPIREEHAGLLPGVDSLRAVADAVGDVRPSELRDQVDLALGFLEDHLVPHAKAEDEVLYPAVARIMGAPMATATMTRDHVEVGRLIDELAALRRGLDEARDVERDLRRVLYGLHAVIRLHFSKEEEIYLPLLDEHLGAEEAESLFTTMEDRTRKHSEHHAA